MSDGRRIIRPIISVALIAVTALGLLNVFEDNTAVINQAQTTACGGSTCAVKMTRMARNPLFQNFTFQTSVKNQTTVDVECRRELYLVGAYKCEKQ